MKKSVLLGLVAAAGGARAVELYFNGPLVNADGLPVLTFPATTLGTASNATQTLADDFSFSGAGWNVASLDFFAYQTNARPFTFTFISVSWSIRSGTDVNASSIVASGTTAVTDGGLFGYRVTPTTQTNTQRAIYRISADIPDVGVAAGSYFLNWALAGTSASRPVRAAGHRLARQRQFAVPCQYRHHLFDEH